MIRRRRLSVVYIHICMYVSMYMRYKEDARRLTLVVKQETTIFLVSPYTSNNIFTLIKQHFHFSVGITLSFLYILFFIILFNSMYSL